MGKNNNHSLASLKEIANWVGSNDADQSGWEKVQKTVSGLSEGSFLDVSNLKASGKGARVVKSKGNMLTHESQPVVSNNRDTLDLYTNQASA